MYNLLDGAFSQSYSEASRRFDLVYTLFQADMLATGKVIKVNVYLSNTPATDTNNQNSEIRVGSVDMSSSGASQTSNALCFKQGGTGDQYIREYECGTPLEGRYVVLYKEYRYAACFEDPSNTICMFAYEVIIFLTK